MLCQKSVSEDSLASHVTGYIKKPRSLCSPRTEYAAGTYFQSGIVGMPAAIGVIVDAKEVVPGIGL